MQASQLAALLQLSSPALPVGSYSYSQGLEAAIECEIVGDEVSAGRWIGQQLDLVMGRCEAPVWALLFQAWADSDWEQALNWNDWFLASRETRELRQETEQMGWSLAKLARDHGWHPPPAGRPMLPHATVALPPARANCAHALGIEKNSGLVAYLFSWLENQGAAAIKTVPLGQVAGQRILNALRQRIARVCDEALVHAAQEPPRVYTLAPQFAILSSRHETQYSRLFRS